LLAVKDLFECIDLCLRPGEGPKLFIHVHNIKVYLSHQQIRTSVPHEVVCTPFCSGAG
jgi:hypothetical protein